MDHDDVKELKQDVKELVKQGIVHNELLRTHEARSISLQQEQKLLQARLVPIEAHVNWVSLILKTLGSVVVFLLGRMLLAYVTKLL